jgi:hypothetical protein
MLPEQRAVFIRKTDPGVMNFLIADVLCHVGGGGIADAERSVTILPFEPMLPFPHPRAGIRFDQGNRGRQGHGRGQMKQQMRMIVETIDRNGQNLLLSADARHIRPEFRSNFPMDHPNTILGAEDNMKMVLDE